jgi:pyridoxal 5'-phosphate synthase pdxT subunit
MENYSKLHIGILALQGDFERHEHQIKLLGAKPHLVKLPAHLNDIDGIIIPGGESTTMNILLDRFDLRKPLIEFCKSHPVFGTCAGMIMLSKKIQDNLSGVEPLGLLDIEVIRNGYGRQVFSFECTVDIKTSSGVKPVGATFIRAPKVMKLGVGIDILAEYNGSPVFIKHGHVMASSFHTELDDDTTIHELFFDIFS